MWIPCFIPLYSPLNLYLIILWILDFKYILLLLLLLLLYCRLNISGNYMSREIVVIVKMGKQIFISALKFH